MKYLESSVFIFSFREIDSLVSKFEELEEKFPNKIDKFLLNDNYYLHSNNYSYLFTIKSAIK